MILNNEKLLALRQSVKDTLSDKRYRHTIGVEQMARYIGSVIMPDKVEELCVAALLHDIAKEIDYNEQVTMLKRSGLAYTEEDLMTKPALHSFAAVTLIKERFYDYATDDVLSAVANHTLGESDMSLFDEIIFISDYTEAGRTYPSCIEIREYLLQNLRVENSYEDNVHALHTASLLSIDATIDSLIKRGEQINRRTFRTKSFLERLV